MWVSMFCFLIFSLDPAVKTLVSKSFLKSTQVYGDSCLLSMYFSLSTRYSVLGKKIVTPALLFRKNCTHDKQNDKD